MPIVHNTTGLKPSKGDDGRASAKFVAPLPQPPQHVVRTNGATRSVADTHKKAARVALWLSRGRTRASSPTTGTTAAKSAVAVPPTAIVTPPNQLARLRRPRTPTAPYKERCARTPRQDGHHDDATGEGTRCHRRRRGSHRAQASAIQGPCEDEPASDDEGGSTDAAPCTARELIAELEMVAGTHTAETVVSGRDGVPVLPDEALFATPLSCPPWHALASAAIAHPVSGLARLRQQRHVSTAKLHRLSHGIETFSATHQVPEARAVSLGMVLVRASMELQLVMNAANTTGSPVWIVTLSEYRCALLMAVVIAISTTHHSLYRSECGKLLRECAASCRHLYGMIAQTKALFDKSVAADMRPRAETDRRTDHKWMSAARTALVVQLGLRTLQLRLLRHIAFVAATSAEPVGLSATKICIEASALSHSMLALLATAQAAGNGEEDARSARAAQNVSEYCTSLGGVLLVAVQSLLEITFWSAGEGQTRLELLHDAAVLLLYRRVHCHQSNHVGEPEATEAMPSVALDAAPDFPRSVPEFMRDLLHFFAFELVAETITDPTRGIDWRSTQVLITSLMHRPGVTAEHVYAVCTSSPSSDGQGGCEQNGAPINGLGEVTAAFVYSAVRDEESLFAALETDEDERLGLAAFLRPQSAEW